MRRSLLFALVLFVIKTSAQLSGAYTIGASPSDFVTLNDARDSINSVGTAGPVTLLIKPGAYTAPVAWGAMNTTDTIALTSQSGDTANTSIELTILTDCENLIIKRLKIKPIVTYPGSFPDKGAVIQRCKNVVIDSCLIVGDFQSPRDIAFTLTDSKGGIRITNNTFLKFNLGIVFSPYSSYNAGYHLGNKEISNNTFLKVGTALKLGGSFQDTTRVQFNRMDSVDIGIEAIHTGQNHELEFLPGLTFINGNSILNVSDQAIHFSPYASGAGHIVISNNMLSGGQFWIGFKFGSSPSRMVDHYRTLQVNHILSGEVINNSIWGGFVVGNVGDLKIRNNAFHSNLKTGFLYRADPKYHCKNNAFYSPFPTDSFAYGYAVDRYLDITSLHDSLQNIWANPHFRSSTDLHACSPMLQAAGIPNGLTTDIDGEARTGNPDIGADEFKNADIPPCPFYSQTCTDSNYTLTFTDTSPRSSSSLWEFSDGTSYTVKSFTKTFAGGGVYTMKLISSNSFESDSLQSTVDFSGIVPQSISVHQNLVSIKAGYSFYQWYKDGVAIAGANSNSYHAITPGRYQVLYQNEQGCKVWATHAPFLSQPNLTIDARQVELYPNPASAIITISSKEKRIRQVELLNLYGQAVKHTDFNAPIGSIGVENLARGMYIARVWLKDQKLPQEIKFEIL